MPAKTPAARALAGFTFVLGTSIYTPAKKIITISQDSTLRNTVISGVMKAKSKACCSAEVRKILIPELTIISRGKISSIDI